MLRVGLWSVTLAFPGNTYSLLSPWLHSDPEGEIDLNGQGCGNTMPDLVPFHSGQA